MVIAVSEITWVAIDPGDSRLSPSHIEGVIRERASQLEITIDWLATHPITEGEHRFGFLIASESDLTTLKVEVLKSLDSSETIHEETIIESISKNENGRFIIFTTTLEKFERHSPAELIAKSAIEQIIAIGEELPEDAMIETSNFLRPIFYEGKITLLVERLYTGDFAPIEKENPHECCGGAHAPH